MSTPPLLHELMGLPKYLLEYHEQLFTDAVQTESALLRNDENTKNGLGGPSLEDELERYYCNDLHITAAVVQLHPLLYKTPGLAKLLALLGNQGQTGTVYEMDRHAVEPKAYLVLGGTLRLITENERNEPVEIGQCRPGQWIGLTSALREFDESEPDKHWIRPAPGSVKAIPCGDSVQVQWLYISELVEAMREHDELVRYVRNHVAIRFARREEILARFKESSICRLLPPADMEYLMQLGTLRQCSPMHVHGEERRPILAAGKPSYRVGLVLSGSCTAFIPCHDDTLRPGETERYAGNFGISHLFGHEGMVMPEELDIGKTKYEPIDSTQGPVQTPDFVIREPPRMTAIYAAPGTEVLEFFWYAFRWTIDDRMATWSRIVNQILPTHHAGRIPEMISLQASRRRLGTSTLSEGLAVELVHRTSAPVCILDLNGERRFQRHFEQHGFTAETKSKILQPTVRAKRSGQRTQQVVHYRSLVRPVDVRSELYWPADVQFLWPVHPEDAESLVEILQTESEFRYVIICMRHDAENADKGAKDLALRLNSRCSTVLYVTDEPEKGYQFSEIEPPNLVWVERMTTEYMRREAIRMKQAMNEARYSQVFSVLSRDARSALLKMIGGFPAPNANSDFKCRRQVVRIPDDPGGATRSDTQGPHALVGPNAIHGPFNRALGRLGRVVMRQTVGVALGGGGAWGFCHIALLQNLHEQNVPIDYITGTSFGSIIGGIFAAGGLEALERLLDENSHNPQNPLTPLLSPLTTPLIRMVMFATLSTISIECFINGHLRRADPKQDNALGLGMTEIPFYPIASNLSRYDERAEEHGTVGHGVRLSGTAPPMAPAFRLNGELIVDGAYVANVPSRHLREIGADFIIAANAVPPASEESPPGNPLSKLTDLAMARFNDTMRANQLLTWKSGEDQGQLYADVACDLKPKNSNFFEMWKGRAIVEQVHRDHFSGDKAAAIRDQYQAFCSKPIPKRPRHY